MKKITLIIIAYSTVVLGCSSTIQPDANWEENRKKEALYESFGVHFTYSNEGKVKAKINGKIVEILKDEQTELEYTQVRDSMRIQFYNSDGSISSILTATDGYLYEYKGFAKAIGNVVLISAEGDTLEAEELHWYRRNDAIKCPVPVKITRKNEVLTGDSLHTNTGMTYYKVFRPRGKLEILE